MSGGRYGPRSTAAGQQGTPGDWAAEAACRGRSHVMFAGRDQGARDSIWAPAKAICGTCLVASPCLDFALATGQTEGVWAGLAPEELRKLARHRRAS